LNCIRSCWHDWLTKKGIFYCRRFDLATPGGRYESKLDIAHSSHQKALRLVPEGSRVLDVGGGNGWLADELSQKKGCHVSIVDAFFRSDPPLHHHTIHHDLRVPITCTLPPADVVLMMDVIEHLPRTEHVALLDRLRREFDDPPARFIISVPNTAFLPLRLSFALLGRLNYGRRGILDDTHAFLFTRRSLRELMDECDYEIHRWHHTPPPYELALGKRKWLARLLTSLHAIAARFMPSLFAYQHMVEASPRPTVATLIRHSFENSKAS